MWELLGWWLLMWLLVSLVAACFWSIGRGLGWWEFVDGTGRVDGPGG
jgi:hypothetical protein